MIIVGGRKMKRTFEYINPLHLLGGFNCTSEIISPGHTWDPKTQLLSNTKFRFWEVIFSDKDLSPNLQSGKDFILYKGVPYLIIEKIGQAGGDIIYHIDFYIDLEIDEESLAQATSNRQKHLEIMIAEEEAAKLKLVEAASDVLVTSSPKKSWYVRFWS
jgi:hypothetical protein